MRAVQFLDGRLVETETITYPSTGRITMRVFEKGSRVPSDIIVIAQGRHIGDVTIQPMDHREVVLYKQFYKC